MNRDQQSRDSAAQLLDQVRNHCFDAYDVHDDLKRAIQDCIEEDRAYWSDEMCAEWIEVVVEHSLPWFICNSWNHLSCANVQRLYDESLRQYHTSNIHQLLRSGLVESWSSTFWDGSNNTNHFFAHRNNAASGKFLKRFVRNHLSQSNPWGDAHSAAFINVIVALIQNERIALLKWLYDHDTTEFMHSLKFMELLVVHQCTDLIEWIVERADGTVLQWTIPQWYSLFVAVHPYHISNRLDRHYRSPRKYRLLLQLLLLFDQQRPSPSDAISWTALCTYTEDHQCMLNFIAISYSGDALLQFIVDRVAAELSAGEDSDPGANPLSHAYRKIESEVISHEGWTPLANAARWGVPSTVCWLLEHDAAVDFTSYTYNSMLTHNLLSLACYNSIDGALGAILWHGRCTSHLYAWLETGYSDIIAGMCSPWITPAGAVVKLNAILDRIPRAEYIKNRWLAAYDHHCASFRGDTTLVYSLLRIPGEITATSSVYNWLIHSHNCGTPLPQLIAFMRENGLRDYAPLCSLLLPRGNAVPHGSVVEDVIIGELARQDDFDASMRRATDPMKKALFFSWCMRMTSHSTRVADIFEKVRLSCQYIRERWQWDLGRLPSEVVHGILQLRCIDRKSIYEMLRSGFPPIIGPHGDKNMSGHHVRNENQYRRLGYCFTLLRRLLRRRIKQCRGDAVRAQRKLHFELLCCPPKPGRALLTRGSPAFHTFLRKFDFRWRKRMMATVLSKIPDGHAHSSRDSATRRYLEWCTLVNSVDPNTTLLLYMVPRGESVRCQLTSASDTPHFISAEGVHDARTGVTFITDVLLALQQTTLRHRLGMLRDTSAETTDYMDMNNALQCMCAEKTAYDRYISQTPSPGRWWPVRVWNIRARHALALARNMLTKVCSSGDYPYNINQVVLTQSRIGKPRTHLLFPPA